MNDDVDIDLEALRDEEDFTKPGFMHREYLLDKAPPMGGYRKRGVIDLPYRDTVDYYFQEVCVYEVQHRGHRIGQTELSQAMIARIEVGIRATVYSRDDIDLQELRALFQETNEPIAPPEGIEFRYAAIIRQLSRNAIETLNDEPVNPLNMLARTYENDGGEDYFRVAIPEPNGTLHTTGNFVEQNQYHRVAERSSPLPSEVPDSFTDQGRFETLRGIYGRCELRAGLIIEREVGTIFAFPQFRVKWVPKVIRIRRWLRIRIRVPRLEWRLYRNIVSVGIYSIGIGEQAINALMDIIEDSLIVAAIQTAFILIFTKSYAAALQVFASVFMAIIKERVREQVASCLVPEISYRWVPEPAWRRI